MALSGIEDHLLICKDGYGNFYVPEWDFSNIGEMRRGQGYYLRMDADDELIYTTQLEGELASIQPEMPSPRRLRTRNDMTGSLPVHLNTGRNMSLLLKADVDVDAAVAVFAGDRLVGTGVLQDGVCGIAVWGDDQTTDEVDGALENQPLEIRILNRGKLSTPESLVLAGEMVYSTDGFTVVQLHSLLTLPLEFGISSAYPNPFNSSLRINYGLVESCDVSLNVYDITGRLVTQLVNGRLNAGNHSTILDGSNLSSGVYMLRLKSGSEVSRMKTVLVK